MRLSLGRRWSYCLSAWLFLFVSVAISAEDPPENELAPSARAYAKDLESLIELVATWYVRPESPTDLLFQGLSGLYGTLEVPVPSDLKSECLKADTEEKRLTLTTKVRLSLGRKCIFEDRKDTLLSGQAMMKSLDRHCTFALAPQFRICQRLTPPLEAFGIELLEQDTKGPVTIEEVIPGSPAQKAGLRPKDIVTHVYGNSLDGANIYSLFNQLGFFDKQTMAIAITLKHGSGRHESWDVVLKRENFIPETVMGISRREDNSWYYWLDRPGRIALIRISRFQKTTASDLQRVLTSLENDGLRGVILDLRWSPGGLLDSSADVMGLFLSKKKLCSIKSRGSKEHLINSKGECKYDKLPIVVLINGETSSSAELLAAAFQDYKRAPLIGQRTIGNGVVVNIQDVGQGNLACITTAMFLRANGKPLLRFANSKEDDDWGVRPDPDLEMRLSPDLDRQLKEQWVLQTLRPGDSNEVLPLDNPEADPVRMRALRLLQKKLRG